MRQILSIHRGFDFLSLDPEQPYQPSINHPSVTWTIRFTRGEEKEFTLVGPGHMIGLENGERINAILATEDQIRWAFNNYRIDRIASTDSRNTAYAEFRRRWFASTTEDERQQQFRTYKKRSNNPA